MVPPSALDWQTDLPLPIPVKYRTFSSLVFMFLLWLVLYRGILRSTLAGLVAVPRDVY
jgi:hypothetical protein